MKLGIAEILSFASGIEDEEYRAVYLRQHESVPLKLVLRGIFDPNIKFLLPEGIPPYKPNDLVDQENVLYHEARKFYLFVEGGSPNLKQNRRETLFIELIEMVDAQDAKLLISMKDKKSPYLGITESVVRNAFPDLLPQELVS